MPRALAHVVLDRRSYKSVTSNTIYMYNEHTFDPNWPNPRPELSMFSSSRSGGGEYNVNISITIDDIVRNVGHGHGVGRASGLSNPSSTPIRPGSYRIASTSQFTCTTPHPPNAGKVRRVPWRWRRRRYQRLMMTVISMRTRSTCSVLPVRGCVAPVSVSEYSTFPVPRSSLHKGRRWRRARPLFLPSDETCIVP